MAVRTQIDIRGGSTLAFALVPWALGIGAVVWLTAFSGARELSHALGQEKRAAVAVGAATLPTAPYQLELDNHWAVKIERATWDGEDLWLYVRNSGSTQVGDIKLDAEQISPDGTVIQSIDEYAKIYAENKGPDSLDPGQRGEMHFKLMADRRTKVLRLRIRHWECCGHDEP